MKPAALGAVLFACALALYARTLDYPFVIDDYTYIAENPAVLEGVPFARYFTDRATTSSASMRIYRTQVYRPLRTLAYRGIAKLWSPTPAAVRAVNLVLYGLAAVLVFLLVRRFVPDDRAAFAGAAVWLALPVHVEAAGQTDRAIAEARACIALVPGQPQCAELLARATAGK